MRAAMAAAGVAAAGLVTYRARDPVGPRRRRRGRTVVLPDFSVPGEKPQLCIASGPDRVATVGRALDAIGGLRRFVGAGDRVLIKVNAAFASPPPVAATSHPFLVAELVRQCRMAGAASVIVTDYPINDPETCFQLSGIGAAAQNAGAEVVVPRPGHFRPTTLEGGELIRDWPLLYEPFEGVTKLIGVAPVKHHDRAGASMTMKNWYGLLGGKRNVFHQDIHGIIRELALLVRPTLVVLDGTTPMLRNGPTGGSVSDLAAMNTMIVATDQVAADAYGATLLGRSAADIPYITAAAAAGAGTANYQMLNPVRIDVS